VEENKWQDINLNLRQLWRSSSNKLDAYICCSVVVRENERRKLSRV
jgi:predicted transcriptional regulator